MGKASIATTNCGMALIAFVLVTGCGKYPETIQTAADINRTPADVTSIRIPRLPLEAYPALAKFKELKRIEFFDESGSGVDDKRLKALAQLQLPKLRDISLLNCPSVADDGIEALAGIKSLMYLQLEGTSLTDRSMEIISARMSLAGVNVANCKRVTANGLARVIKSDSLQELTFSADNVTEAEIIGLLNHAKHLNHCEIVDPKAKLRLSEINTAAQSRNIQILVRSE